MKTTSVPAALPAILFLVACGAESQYLDGGFVKPPHWVESSPEPGAFLEAAPATVTVRFNFDLHRSKTKGLVFRNGLPVPVEQSISDNRKTLTLDLKGAVGDGTWRVELDACWPDGSCHPGQFIFYVNVEPPPDQDVLEPGPDAAGDGMADMPPHDGSGGHDPGPPAPGVGEFQRPAHFTDSFPVHGESFAAAPAVLVVNYDFTLHATLTGATVRLDGTEVPVAHQVTGDGYAQRIDLQGAAGDGVWEVLLKACWPDASCHDGRVAFRVDAATRADYADRSGLAEVMVTMKDIAFEPRRIVVSRGTKVTWVDQDLPEHYVNSDPHPSHNVIPEMNSEVLNDGDTFSFTFDRAGEWGYHCSAHTEMTGRVLVVP